MTTSPSYASSSLQPDEPTTAITPNVTVPQSRAMEWMRGTRPLDGMDADFYFKTQVDAGMLTREEAFLLHRRHLHLTRQEQRAAGGALVCKSCQGGPPPGFTCRTCGAEA
jgi:hypothetical protein